jgi:hypothetical protein
MIYQLKQAFKVGHEGMKVFGELKNDLKNSIFWEVTQCGSCKNRRFGGT